MSFIKLISFFWNTTPTVLYCLLFSTWWQTWASLHIESIVWDTKL